MEAEAQSNYRFTQVRLWLGFLGSAIVWFVHLAAIYTLAESVCPLGFPWGEAVGLFGVELIIIGLTVAAVSVCVVSGLVAYRNGKWLETHDPSSLPVSRGAAQYIAHGGVYLSALFILIIVTQLVPLFFLRPCP